jgi:hypothetical protein
MVSGRAGNGGQREKSVRRVLDSLTKMPTGHPTCVAEA